MRIKCSGCRVIRAIECDAPVTMVHLSVRCTTLSHCTLHLILGLGIIECCGGVCGPHAACGEG